MLEKYQLERYAEIMLWGLRRGRGAPLRKSAFIQVRFELPGLRLAEEICGLLHEEGFVPLPTLMPTPRLEFDFFTKAGAKRLGILRPGDLDLYSALSGGITILAPESLTHLTDVDSERMAIAQSARAKLTALLRAREAEHAYGWTICLMPTQALADQAGVSVEEYGRTIAEACYLNEPDPVAAWKALTRETDALCRQLNSLGNARLHIEADGTDLWFNVGASRKWVGLTGRNIPSFEIYVSPDWRTVEGSYRADLASFRMGTVVEDVRLIFSQGRLLKLRAHTGAPFAREQAAIDAGAGRVGEFALVDKRFSRINRFMATTLYDENFGGEHGSMHLALGQSYTNTYGGSPEAAMPKRLAALGFNTSTIHWDLISTLPRRVSVIMPGNRRMTIYEDGMFVL